MHSPCSATLWLDGSASWWTTSPVVASLRTADGLGERAYYTRAKGPIKSWRLCTSTMLYVPAPRLMKSKERRTFDVDGGATFTSACGDNRDSVRAVHDGIDDAHHRETRSALELSCCIIRGTCLSYCVEQRLRLWTAHLSLSKVFYALHFALFITLGD